MYLSSLVTLEGPFPGQYDASHLSPHPTTGVIAPRSSLLPDPTRCKYRATIYRHHSSRPCVQVVFANTSTYDDANLHRHEAPFAQENIKRPSTRCACQVEHGVHVRSPVCVVGLVGPYAIFISLTLTSTTQPTSRSTNSQPLKPGAKHSAEDASSHPPQPCFHLSRLHGARRLRYL